MSIVTTTEIRTGRYFGSKYGYALYVTVTAGDEVLCEPKRVATLANEADAIALAAAYRDSRAIEFLPFHLLDLLTHTVPCDECGVPVDDVPRTHDWGVCKPCHAVHYADQPGDELDDWEED